ncbi:S8 family serine peptidase [Polyangium jinanense]|uniref:S8 family serine peptidase n=1 Tax=Polyangium jinanense TaxID=2829994 RepID=A0A9X3X7T8_9BACT|nr:S8 family serine peptidase [Polyangium jinanense]MDC3982921.1 S8 family serine peptidase [Polyangium jinanense]
MRRFRWIHLLALPSLLAACGGEPDGEQADGNGDVYDPSSVVTREQNETPEFWFVELEEKPLLRGGSESLLLQQKVVFKAEAEKRGISYTERLSFHRLWNGLSIRVAPEHVAELARIPGVKSVWPVVPIQQEDTPEDGGPQMDMATAIAMTGVDIARSQLGLTGTNVRVGIIDSGVDYDHPDLGGGCFGPGCRVQYGYDFVGDGFQSGVAGAYAIPDADPDDCGGHGTHVAGIVGANGAVVGVAPEVTLGAYRVFGCAGSTSTDIMIQAMERAQQDGMRVVNMSIGSGYQWPQYPTAVAASNLSKNGTIVSCSGGNNGDRGVWATGAPGVGTNVFASASAENTHVAQLSFSITPDAKSFGYNVGTGVPPAPLTGTLEIVATATANTITTDACNVNPPAAGSLTGKVALIKRGGCTFFEKSKNAQAAGASAVVVYNNAAGALVPGVTIPTGSPAGTTPVGIPVVGITMAEGDLIVQRLGAGAVSLTWTDDTVTSPNSVAGRISTFSSWGAGPDLSFKPDLTSPGGSIYSTYPLEIGGYTSQSGTSMASPHTAGSIALLIQATGETDFDAIRARLQNTAEPLLWGIDPSTGILDSAHRQGAGLIRVDKAAVTTASVWPSRIALGETTGPTTQTITLKNDGNEPITYDVSHQPGASSVGTYGTPAALSKTDVPPTADFSAQSVTVPANGTATVEVTITPNPNLADQGVYGGFIKFAQTGGTTTLRVPYIGFKGDYQSIVALVPTAQGFPWLSRQNNSTNPPTYNKQNAGAVFTMSGTTNVPNVTLHVEHQVTTIKVDIVEAAGLQKPWGTAYTYTYVGRNADPTGTYSFAWNGTTTIGKNVVTVPNGNYVMKMSVLKALGDANNPAHWETWTSPSFKVERP